jgi:hypothetical protein
VPPEHCAIALSLLLPSLPALPQLHSWVRPPTLPEDIQGAAVGQAGPGDGSIIQNFARIRGSFQHPAWHGGRSQGEGERARTAPGRRWRMNPAVPCSGFSCSHSFATSSACRKHSNYTTRVGGSELTIGIPAWQPTLPLEVVTSWSLSFSNISLVHTCPGMAAFPRFILNTTCPRLLVNAPHGSKPTLAHSLQA